MRTCGIRIPFQALHGRWPWPPATAIADPLDDLNALRAANGLPAGIVENPAWSAGCALHMNYLALNDFAGDWHTEAPWPPRLHGGRSRRRGQLGALRARRRSARPDWEDAPFHFAQLLAPKLSVTGYAAGLHLHVARLPAARAAGAATSTPIPGDGASASTSPYLYVFGFGGGTTGGTLSDASLTGPAARSRCA